MAPVPDIRCSNDPVSRNLMWTFRTEIASTASGILSTAIMFPLDSIKSRMQTYPYKGVTDCVKRSYAREGISGFFRGELSLE